MIEKDNKERFRVNAARISVRLQPCIKEDFCG